MIFQFNQMSHMIIERISCGFEDWGNKRTNKPADHVLVFILRGLNTDWKMIISYNFCAKATKHIQLICCIKEHVHAIYEAGFHIVATVWDLQMSLQ